MRTLLLLRGAMGSGKAQPLTSKILKTNGEWILMKDIKVGDEIFDGLGNPTKVIGVYPQGLKDVYELTTYDNRKCLASSEHLWKVRSIKQRSKYNKCISILEQYFKIYTTLELVEDINKEVKKRVQIPVPKKLEYPKKDLKIPPYLLGALLGDGCLSQHSKVYFSNTELDVINRVKNLIEETYPNLTLKKNNSCQCQYNVQYKNGYNHKNINNKKLLNDLEYYNLLGTKSHNKFIPNEYLLGNSEQRLELLKGLMDTDGYSYDGSYSISTVSEQLMKDLVYLGRSLGYIITVYIGNRKDKYKNSGCLYNIRFQTNDFIVSSKKHIDKLTHKNKKYYSHIYFKSINYIGKLECQCIKVDSQDETYITDDFIVTHNTTWIKNNNLQPYTLSADDFRTMICNPVLDLNGDLSISQENDRLAWNMLLQCLEERMKRGDFTVIDATHSTQKMVANYKALADMYKYTMFVKEFRDVPLEVCLERNRMRDRYKFVPENAIRRCYTLIQETELSKGVKKIDDISEIDNFYIDDVNKYEKVVVIGDIHSCNTALGELLEKEWNENTLFVFLGDYLDRGLEHRETLKRMFYLSKKPNVILLEGNHEINLVNWCQNRDVRISKKFLFETVAKLTENMNEEEIEEFKKECRIFYKRLRQAYAFNFNGVNYLCTHAGLPSVPKLTYISSEAMIKGIGGYDDDISGIYEENFVLGKCQDFTQIFGHRTNKTTEHSINLEGQVEFGGELMYLVITKDGREIKTIKNEVYDRDYFLKERLNYKRDTTNLTENEEVNNLIISRLVKVKECNPNLLSLNFGENVFRKKIWNDVTIKARGLFVDKISGEVKLRSYNKFFNMNEMKETIQDTLKETLSYPVIVKIKENGFLGLISVIDDEFVLATKSTTGGDWKTYFEELWNREKDEVKQELKEFIKRENCTLLFEVKSFKDKHIINFNKEELVLLDVVKNDLNLNGHNIDVEYSNNSLKFIDKNYLLPLNSNIIRIVEVYKIINAFDEVEHLYSIASRTSFKNEGFVFTDSNGFMFKLKSEYYNVWKGARKCYLEYKKNPTQNFPYRMCKTPFEINFMKWLIKKGIDFVKEKDFADIIDYYYKIKE